MEDMATIGELAIKEAKENELRKVLEIMRDCKDEGKDLDEATKRIKALLEK